LRSKPGTPKVMRKIPSQPSPGDRHPARTHSRGRLRVQRPVQLVAVRRGGYRLIIPSARSRSTRPRRWLGRPQAIKKGLKPS
jgi:hypothetical protein